MELSALVDYIKLIYCPAHSCTTDIEIVDNLAKKLPEKLLIFHKNRHIIIKNDLTGK